MKTTIIIFALGLVASCGYLNKAGEHLSMYCNGCSVNEAEIACAHGIRVYESEAEVDRGYSVVSAYSDRNLYSVKSKACSVKADAVVVINGAWVSALAINYQSVPLENQECVKRMKVFERSAIGYESIGVAAGSLYGLVNEACNLGADAVVVESFNTYPLIGHFLIKPVVVEPGI